MTTDRIRLGVIGANVSYGWTPRAHMPAIRNMPDIELAAVCTAHEETARESAETFGASLAFHDHREMLRHADLDAVAVVVRVPLHHRLTMDALDAGKHVYTEWPLGANLQEAKEMADLARTQGVHTMVGLQSRCSPAFLTLKELIDDGYLGEVLSCHLDQFASGVLTRTSDRTWQRDRTLGATTLTISFGHAIDAMCMCLGEFREVAAVVRTRVAQWHEKDTGRDTGAQKDALCRGCGGGKQGYSVQSRAARREPGRRNVKPLELLDSRQHCVAVATHGRHSDSLLCHSRLLSKHRPCLRFGEKIGLELRSLSLGNSVGPTKATRRQCVHHERFIDEV